MSKTTKRATKKQPAARLNPGKPAIPAGRVEVRNPNVPGYTFTVERPRYEAMKKALLKVLPRRVPGFTQEEMMKAVKPHLSEALFPGGAKAGWWTKCVQLDLEARGEVVRDPAVRPLRWTKVQ